MSPVDRVIALAHALGRVETLIGQGRYEEAVAHARRAREEVINSLPPEASRIAAQLRALGVVS